MIGTVSASVLVTESELGALFSLCEAHSTPRYEMTAALVRYMVDEMPLEERKYIVELGGAEPSAPFERSLVLDLDEDLLHLFVLASGLKENNVPKAVRGLYLWALTLSGEDIDYVLARPFESGADRWSQLREETELIG